MAKPRTRLPALFLQTIRWRDAAARPDTYPFNLPCLRDPDFALRFTTPVTILVGENGVGKSTLIEAMAQIAGYDEAGGGKGYRPIDHSRAGSFGCGAGRSLARRLAAESPRRWFFRAESFYSVARSLDEAAQDVGAAPPDFLSWSHGEGFLRDFAERCTRPGLYLMDEPESALSPARQLDLLVLLSRLQTTATAQVIMATHSPLLMDLPGARLLQITRLGLEEVDFRQTHHFRLYESFTRDPLAFVAEALTERSESPLTQP